jgi:hypothetical protein
MARLDADLRPDAATGGDMSSTEDFFAEMEMEQTAIDASDARDRGDSQEAARLHRLWEAQREAFDLREPSDD